MWYGPQDASFQPLWDAVFHKIPWYMRVRLFALSMLPPSNPDRPQPSFLHPTRDLEVFLQFFKMISVTTGLALTLAYLTEAIPNVERRTSAPKYNVLITDKVSQETRGIR